MKELTRRILTNGSPESCRDCIATLGEAMFLAGQVGREQIGEDEATALLSEVMTRRCPYGDFKARLGKACMDGVAEKPDLPTRGSPRVRSRSRPGGQF